MLQSESPAHKRPNILAYRSPPTSGGYTSSSLAQVMEDLSQRKGKLHILDLGNASSKTLQHFSKQRCRITFENLASDLAYRAAAPDDVVPNELWISKLFDPDPAGEKLDLILCWDLVNYLNHTELADLFYVFETLADEKTWIYAMFSTLLVMPETPGTFTLTEKALVEYSLPTDKYKTCPRYCPRELQRMFNRFAIARLLLLKNGYYEILFQMGDAPSGSVWSS